MIYVTSATTALSGPWNDMDTDVFCRSGLVCHEMDNFVINPTLHTAYLNLSDDIWNKRRWALLTMFKIIFLVNFTQWKRYIMKDLQQWALQVNCIFNHEKRLVHYCLMPRSKSAILEVILLRFFGHLTVHTIRARQICICLVNVFIFCFSEVHENPGSDRHI